MSLNIPKTLTGLAFAVMSVAQLAPAACAYPNYYYANPYGYGYNPYAGPYGYYGYSVFNTHPILSSTLVGTAVGALGGAAVGAVRQSEHAAAPGSLGADSAVGAGIGGMVGAGVGLLRNRALTGFFF